ncbi:MAG TPA: NADPH-dependent F420 reductase [Candidatus Cybelea sp.]|nr:NADPH-dependent F420 reductase [Candidatus Cybelea sp.]
MTMKATIAVLGGTGHEGRGLALRWAKAGYPIVIGSRDGERAIAAAAEMAASVRGASVAGASNVAAAERATIAVLTVPYAAQKATLESVKHALQGKILVDVTVPLQPPRVARVQLPPQDSAVLAGQELLGPGVKVVSAFQNVSAHLLESPGDTIDCDVLVCGDDKDARGAVIELARAAGMRGIHGGALVNSAAAEALTSVLIFINGRYKIQSSGIRFTGIPDEPAT